MAAKYDRIRKLRYEGAVDADGHILEGADLWARYLEAKYKPMALLIKRDDRGTQYLEIAGRPSKITRGPVFARMCSMGTPSDQHREIRPTKLRRRSPARRLRRPRSGDAP